MTDDEIDAINLRKLFGINPRVKELERVHSNTLRFFGRLFRTLESDSIDQQQIIAQLTARVTELERVQSEHFERTAKRIMIIEAELHTMQDPVIGGCGSPLS